MSGGQPVPPRIEEAFAISAPSGVAGSGPGFKTAPFPVAPPGTLGAASLENGFGPLNSTPTSSGGVAPFGEDANGILYLLSAHIAAIAAGQPYLFDATLAAFMSGYALGAVVQQAADTTAFWINTVSGNASDPDSGTPGTAGWVSTKPLQTSIAPAAGITADNTLPGPSDYFLDVDTTAGAVTLNGFVAQRDGQRLTISCTGANNLTIGNLTGSAGNQVRASSVTTLVTNDSVTIQHNATINAWVVV